MNAVDFLAKNLSDFVSLPWKPDNPYYHSVDDLDEKKKEKPKKISQELSDCVNYIHAVHFHGFSGDQDSKYYHMSSFGESKAFKFIEDPETSLDFVNYNCRQISRIYPGAKRQDSSNLKVVPPWNAGCQIGKKKFCVLW